VTSQTFPYAIYGKDARSCKPGADRPHVLFQSGDFPAAASVALERLAGSFQWSGGEPEERYGECYALWPLGQGLVSTLVARLMDAGCDQLGCPHVLRVEAVYVELADLTSSPARLGGANDT
jgi:hypothetical protein